MLETIVIQVTTRCPFDCPQCYIEKGSREMDFDVAKSIVNWALKNNVQMVQFTGGEPMVYPHLEELVKYCHLNGLLTAIATSGYNCSSSKLQQLENSGVDAICVSLNGFKKNTDFLTRRTFQYAVNALTKLKEHNITSFINFVITKDNYSELEAVSRFAKEHEVEKIILLRPFGKCFKNAMLSRNELLNLKCFCDNEEGFLQVENCYLEYWSVVYDRECFCNDATKKTLFFTVDGYLKPCSKSRTYSYENPDDIIRGFSFDGRCLFNE